MAQKSFIDYIVEKTLISREKTNDLLVICRKENISLVAAIIKGKYLTEQQILTALSSYLSMPPIRITHMDISKEVVALVPEKIARAKNIMPIGKIGKTLTVAMADPLDILVIDDLKNITSFEINPVIAGFSEIQSAIANSYGVDAMASLEAIMDDKKGEKLELVEDEKQNVSQEQIVKSLDDAPVIKFTQHLLERAVMEKTSDVFIEPLAKKGRIRFRVDGILKEVDTYPKSIHQFIISRVKVLSKLNITEHRLPQDGRFRILQAGRHVDFRVSVMPSSMGEKVVLRVLDQSAGMLDLDSLGFSEKVVKELKEDSLKPHGLILVCGPTGSGKSTSLYSILKHIYSPEKNITTVEDPVEYQIKGISQASINPSIGLTFAACLRAILRQDPDVVMIGEIRDAETADIAIKAALTGHLVLATIHTTTSAGAITRLINMGIEPFLLATTLIGALAQRLSRKLCGRCKEKLQITSQIKKRYSLPDDAQLYASKGCNNCGQQGFLGRVSIGEYLRVTDEIKELIYGNVSEHGIKKKSRALGMKTLREDGLEKVARGITSLEDILKRTAQDEDATNK